MRKIRMSGSVGASGEQSPEATRPGLLLLPHILPPDGFNPPVLKAWFEIEIPMASGTGTRRSGSDSAALHPPKIRNTRRLVSHYVPESLVEAGSPYPLRQELPGIDKRRAVSSGSYRPG
jgi:hypothetical protein